MSEPTLVVAREEMESLRVVVRGDAYRHLFRARRLASGDTVRLVDGAGRAVMAKVERVSGRSAELTVVGESPSHEPEVRLEVWVGLPRPQRASWLVEKVTELGVAAVRWVDSERAERRIGDAGLARLERVARAAVEQCGRARIPQITGPHAWPDVVARAARGSAWLLDAGASGRSAPDDGRPSEQPASGAADTSMILVGPEGGFTSHETGELDDAGIARLGLGARILRVETAAVAGVAVLMWMLRRTGSRGPSQAPPARRA